jgi:hypothetical protein
MYCITSAARNTESGMAEVKLDNVIPSALTCQRQLERYEFSTSYQAPPNCAASATRELARTAGAATPYTTEIGRAGRIVFNKTLRVFARTEINILRTETS